MEKDERVNGKDIANVNYIKFRCSGKRSNEEYSRGERKKRGGNEQ
jgi:hypothetical protein